MGFWGFGGGALRLFFLLLCRFGLLPEALLAQLSVAFALALHDLGLLVAPISRALPSLY